MRSFHALLIAAFALLEVSCISVPTGKETPITPAKSTPRPIYQRTARAPAPVIEYSVDEPEPAPLDPSYVPITYKYIQALIPYSINYTPVKIRNPAYRVYDTPQGPVYITFKKYYDYKYAKTKPAPFQRIPTKSGYPKKVTSTKPVLQAAEPSNKYYYYLNPNDQ